MLTISVAIGLAAGIGFGVFLSSRAPASPLGEAQSAVSGHRIVSLGLAAIVGAEAYSGTLAAFVTLYNGDPPTQVTRSALAIFLCWLTFKGNRFAYWFLVITYGIAIAVILPTAVTGLFGTGPGAHWSTWLLFTIWCGAIAAITVTDDGRLFIERQQAERRERKRAYSGR